MQATSPETGGQTLTDLDYLRLAQDALAQRSYPALAALLATADERPDLWVGDAGQMLLVEMLGTVLDALGEGDVIHAAELISACPVSLAEKSHSLLLLSFFPDGHVGNLAQLDDAALICLALLTHRMGHRGRANELLDKAIERHLPQQYRDAADVVRRQFASTAKSRFKAKLIIWGVDGTFWQKPPVEGQMLTWRSDLAAFIPSLNAHGIVSAICAQADAATVRSQLEAGGLWDEFVFPRISPQSLGEAVEQLIHDMLLQPSNVLFIDGDAANLVDVRSKVPGIRVMDAGAAECAAMLQRLIDENHHVNANRVADYRILEARVADRNKLSDADFLIQSGIQATYTHRMDNLAFVERIEELINRADPLNYTETRVVPGTLREIVMNVSDYDIFSAFIWDKYGHHGLDGLVGVVVYHRPSRRPLHLAFSCRIMHMGVEDFLIKALVERYGAVDLTGLAKPLPLQSSAAITYVPFEQVRESILAAQAPGDPARIRLRVMSDCMSGGFHHYSRFKDEMDFDNIPRIFSLPMMLTGAYREQQFPDHLVYNAAIDYMEPRWKELMPVIDLGVYEEAQKAFCKMVVDGGRKMLVLLSPENASDQYHAILPHMSGAELKARDAYFNRLWRDAAARHPGYIDVVELTDFVTEADMLTHAYHYSPSILKHMTELVDDWYARGAYASA
jgi:FkbH-like protein